MTTRTALVLGVTGMVGHALAADLLANGWTVYGAARFHNEATPHSRVPAGCRPVRFDVLQDDPRALPDVDTLFLEIWEPNRPDRLWELNFYGVGRVVERYAGAAEIVNGSTINVYGDQPGAPDEAAPCRPTSDYGRCRYAQERLIDYFCERGGRAGIHVRYAHANSAATGVIRSMAEAILAARSLGPNPDSGIQVIALEDLVRVTHQAADRADRPPNLVNCCHPHIWTQRALAEAIQQKLGRGQVVFDRPSGGAENSVVADVNRMRAWFGEPRVTFAAMLARVLESLPA